MNLALPLWLFTEPLPPKKNFDQENDPEIEAPVKAIPPGILYLPNVFLCKFAKILKFRQDLLCGIKLKSMGRRLCKSSSSQ